jgi:alpha-tubulin suppressor-like RCC1 family protein
VARLLFCPVAARALPRPPFPPIPESGVIYHQTFDGFHSVASGDARAVIPGLGMLVESWSGYALERGRTNVLPWIVPAVDPNSGHTNLTCDAAGAIRFWFEPHFSSASIAGGTGPGATARLADLVASSPAGTAVVWSLQISADGTVLQLLGYGDSGPVQLLSAPIAWQERQYHNVALNYGPQGTGLFIDGQLVAQGGGTVTVPASGGALVWGSSFAGTDTAHGAFDEFFSFGRVLTAGDAAFYYQFTAAEAALGPVSDWELAFAAASATPMALPRVYDPDHDITCSPGGPVYITNVFATLQTNGLTTFSFDIAGGTNGVFYDIFSTTNLNHALDNSAWSWLGQGLTCNPYSFTNQPASGAFYMLTLPMQTTVFAWGRDEAWQSDVPLGLTTAEAIAAGGDFSLALLTNGTVIAWGTNNTYGQTNIPAGLTNVVSIAAGQCHGLALLANGAVTNWGAYWDGVTNYPVTNFDGISGPPSSNVMAIAAGAGHDLALMSNGTLVSWGLTNIWPNSSNVLAFQTNLTSVKAIACGWNHSVALLSNGVVQVWGLNASNLNWNLTNVPADLTNVVAIAAGGLHNLALRTNGTVEAWGVNNDGQTNVPAGLSNVVAVSAGGGWSLALQANGTVVYWGNTNLAVTTLPTNMLGVKAISAGFQHTLAIASDGMPPLLTEPPAGFAPAGGSITYSVIGVRLANVQYQWQFITNYMSGTNIVLVTNNITGATNSSLMLNSVNSADDGSYQVVVSSGSSSATSLPATFNLAYPPQIVSTIPSTPCTNWFNTSVTLSVAVNAVGQSSYPVTYLWQLNATNLAYTGTTPNLTIYPSAAADGLYTVWATNALGSNSVSWDMRAALPGMVEAWGADGSGEIDRPAGLTNVAGIAAGEYQSIAVTDSGTVVQWGKYSDGTNLYPVTNLTICSPPPGSNVVAVAAGMGQALALMTKGTVFAWGLSNAYGTTVPANITNGVKAVACGDQFDLVLLTNGTVAAWGYGGTNGSLTNVPSSVTNAIAIAAGAQHSLALLANGTVVGWGYNPAGETNVPAGLSNVVAIAAGAHHNLALISTNGTVVAWGTNNFGQTNVPAGLSNVLAIAAGANHSVALKNDSVTLIEWGYNGSGQATVPPNQPTPNFIGAPYIVTNILPASIVKLIAAGGNHTLASIWSPLVQYPVDVTKDLLLIYNTNSLNSSNVCAYYQANRPMVANCSNVLGIGCTTSEITDPGDYRTNLAGPIQNWLAMNPTKRPAYVILFQDIPSRVELGGSVYPSVQCQINATCATNWQPLVTSINMNGTGGTNDCIAYINKLTNIASSNPPGTIVISSTVGNYGNTNWYFDDSKAGGGIFVGLGIEARLGVLAANPSASVFYSSNAIITLGVNVAGYYSPGIHNGAFSPTYPIDGELIFSGQSRWYLIETDESFNGIRNFVATGQGNFLEWYASNAFGGSAYANTPVGAVSHVEEPGSAENNPYLYFGLWAQGKIFSICAWNSFYNYGTPYLQVVGDPFVTE